MAAALGRGFTGWAWRFRLASNQPANLGRQTSIGPRPVCGGAMALCGTVWLHGDVLHVTILSFYTYSCCQAVRFYTDFVGTGSLVRGYLSMPGLIPVSNLDCPKVWQILLPINHYGAAPKRSTREVFVKLLPQPVGKRKKCGRYWVPTRARYYRRLRARRLYLQPPLRGQGHGTMLPLCTLVPRWMHKKPGRVRRRCMALLYLQNNARWYKLDERPPNLISCPEDHQLVGTIVVKYWTLTTCCWSVHC